MTTRPHLLTDSAPVEAQHVDELSELRQEIDGLREELGELRLQQESFIKEVGRIFAGFRATLSGTTTEPTVTVTGGTNTRWEALKRAFPGRPAELVDVLIAHGPLNTTQIAAIMRADPRTVNQLIYKLNKAGGIEKNEGKFSLK